MLARSAGVDPSRRGRSPGKDRRGVRQETGPAFVPVDTKLHAPGIRPGLVPRPRLQERLSAAKAKLLLLSAPVGYGKTTLLAERRAQAWDEQVFAWVTLDTGDDDPARLWRYVVEAMRR